MSRQEVRPAACRVTPWVRLSGDGPWGRRLLPSSLKQSWAGSCPCSCRARGPRGRRQFSFHCVDSPGRETPGGLEPQSVHAELTSLLPDPAREPIGVE